MQFCSVIVVICLILYLTPPAAAQKAPGVCPRPSPGAGVQQPDELRGASGSIRASFSFWTYVDVYGLQRYCYLDANGAESPTLRLHAGDELVLTLKNNLSPAGPATHAHTAARAHDAGSANSCAGGVMTASSTNLHFHGLNVPPVCHQDETIRTLIQPSDPAFEYRIRIPESTSPGLYWYHPHPHGFSEAQVLGGASGALIVEGIERRKPEVAGLPERVLVLRDQRIPGLQEEAEDAGPGKDVSINFVPVMYPLYRPANITVRPAEREFWRVLNAAADTYFDLQIRFGKVIQEVQDPQPLRLVALDGAPMDDGLPPSTHILLSPGARAEFIVTTPPLGMIGQIVTLQYDTGPDGAATPYRAIANIFTSRDTPRPAAMPVGDPPAGKRFSGLTDLTPVRTRKLYLSEVKQNPQYPMNAVTYFITEEGATPKPFDMNFEKPDIVVRQGTVEDWIVENRAQEAHSFHIHQLHFQLLERDGKRVDEPALRDTIDLPYWTGPPAPYPSVKLRMNFQEPQIVGTFLYHCHILEHEDGGMMGSIRVDPAWRP